MSTFLEKAQVGVDLIRRRDKTLRKVIDIAGPMTLRLDRNHFRMLVRSILSQQLSTAAARTIRMRVEDLLDNQVKAETFAKLKPAQLRACGVSAQKVGYLQSLTEACVSKQVNLTRVARLSDEEIIEELITIKGIGRWTAQMFLIFSLGRLDVFPIDDLGVRVAMQRIYGLAKDVPRANYLPFAEKWRPYATVASWYCWRSLEQKPKK
jgi:DNA-3-methyladenine glycosylase II